MSLKGFLVILVLAVAFVGGMVCFICKISELPEPDYITIEGEILGIKEGEKLALIWENDSGTYALFFAPTNKPLPIGVDVRLTYYLSAHFRTPTIENVELLEGEG